jgi:tetratricopeptide (TPR) repeat protein
MEGVLALDTGAPDEARDAFDLALDLARDARDTRLEALVTTVETWLWSPAQMGARATGDSRQAVTAMEHACALGQHAPAPAQAWLHAYHAWHLAAAGDASAWARALASAQDAADAIDPDEHGWGFFSTDGEFAGFSSGRIHAFEGDARLLLGQHADAIGPLQQAIDTAYMPLKQTILRRSLMGAWAGAGEPEPACAAGITCLDQADMGHLTLHMELVRDIRETFPGNWSHLDCVRELDDRLRAIA